MRAEAVVWRRYVAGLFSLAHDTSGDVRKTVCTGLVQMLHLQPQRLQPHMQEIIEYMLASTQASFAIAKSSCITQPHLTPVPQFFVASQHRNSFPCRVDVMSSSNLGLLPYCL